MEILDLYDKDLNLTGQTIVRGDKIPENCFINIVVVFIQNSKGEFLIQRTSEAKGHKFASTGGHIKSGEDSLTTIQTEVYEELGVLLDKSEFEFISHSTRNQVIFDIYYTKQDLDVTNLKLQTEEVESAQWCTKQEIEEFISQGIFSPSHTEFYNKFIKENY